MTAVPAVSRPNLIRHPDFVKLWVAESISMAGSQISQLAIPLLAIVLLNASAFEVGLLTSVGFLPFLLFGLPAGVWVDRLRRRPILIAADVGRALLLATIPLAWLLGSISLPQLYLVTFLAGILTVFFDVGYQSYLPSLVHSSQLMEGNGKLEMSRASAQVAGPGLAGALVQLAGAPLAIAIDALSFVASGLFLVAIRRPEAQPGVDRPRTSMLVDIREGLRFVLGHPLLRPITAATAIANLFSAIASSVMLIFAVRELLLDPVLIGAIIAVGSSGGVVGALIATRVQRRIGVGRTMILCEAGFAAGYLLLPVASVAAPVFLATLGLFLATLGSIVFSIVGLTLRQRMAPTRMQGRTNATVRTINWGVLPIGFFVGGVLGTIIGIVPTLIVGALGLLLATLPILFSPVRTLREMPLAVEAD
ncbi:MAG: MFS transporter [Chloroflexi bacterium]|nr:MFS transporter [Chloroflexota bacterium]